METRSDLPAVRNTDNEYFLGVSNATAYYFYYRPREITTLNHAFLRTVQTRAEGYLIYADRNTLSAAEMRKFGIAFKKIPRDIAKL